MENNVTELSDRPLTTSTSFPVIKNFWLQFSMLSHVKCREFPIFSENLTVAIFRVNDIWRDLVAVI
jgi:hypothetical protein